MKVSAVITGAGRGLRMGGVAKQFMDLAGRPVIAHTLAQFQSCALVDEIVVVTPPPDIERVLRDVVERYGFSRVSHVVGGGATRQESVYNGIMATSPDADVVLVHDAVRPLVTVEMIQNVTMAAFEHGAAVPGVPVKDTIKMVDEEGFAAATPPRERLVAAQTPQAFRRDVIVRAHEAARRDGFLGTDDAALVERLGGRVAVVPGAETNIKLTTPEDVAVVERFLSERIGRAEVAEDVLIQPSLAGVPRVGIGYDAHRFGAGRRLVLGGVEIPFEAGLVGHSDADVLCHAVADAVLGAAGLRDIGFHFPDSDPRWEGVSSLEILRISARRAREHGLVVTNVDVSVIAEAPKLGPYVERMKANLAEALGITPDRVGIKATSNEGMGFVGRREGVAASAVAMLIPVPVAVRRT